MSKARRRTKRYKKKSLLDRPHAFHHCLPLYLGHNVERLADDQAVCAPCNAEELLSLQKRLLDHALGPLQKAVERDGEENGSI